MKPSPVAFHFFWRNEMDNKKKRGPEDRRLVNLSQKDELRYWSKALKCTKRELVLAVEATFSSSSKEVRRRLRSADARVRRAK